MTWCLGEALLDRDRDWLKTASVLALYQDGRRLHLGAYFAAANPNMDRRQGILGPAKMRKGTGSEALRAQTIQIYSDVCTPRSGLQTSWN
eukprot:7234218-Pyramimonas_sp.AAC.1